MTLRRRGGPKEHINFVLPVDLKRQLEERAEEQIVSISHLLRQLVRVYLKNASKPAAAQPTASEVWPISKPAVRGAVR